MHCDHFLYQKYMWFYQLAPTCFERRLYYFFFIVAQPSKQFILNSINKFMWQFNINNIIQMKPKDDLRYWNKRSHKLASSLNALRANLTSSLIFYFLFLDHKFKMDRIGFNWLWCWNTHLYYPSFPLYSMFNVYTMVSLVHIVDHSIDATHPFDHFNHFRNAFVISIMLLFNENRFHIHI